MLSKDLDDLWKNEETLRDKSPPQPKPPPHPDEVKILNCLPKVISIRDGRYTSYPYDKESQVGDATAPLETTGSPPVEPTLRLVVVPRNEGDKLVQPEEFWGLVKVAGIDAVIYQHITLCSYGFYHYDNHNMDEESPRTHSFYFGCFLYSIAWSFDPATMVTSGVLILRIVERHYYGALPLRMLERVISVYKSHQASPLFLAFASFNMLAHVLDDNIYRNVNTLREIETGTGHGPGRGNLSHQRPNGQSTDYKFDRNSSCMNTKPELGRQETTQLLETKVDSIDRLTRVSQRLADCNVHLANLQRHVKLLLTMAETLEDPVFRQHHSRGLPTGHMDAVDRSTDALLLTLPALKRRIRTVEPSIEYLQDRAKSLSHAVRYPIPRFLPH